MSNFEAASMEDYYRYHEIKVTINIADDFTIPRISQFTHCVDGNILEK
jgi:predicted enzyme involved in methoxymalonyl-ACP biosynthesis